jgi:DNA-binding IscR family transcriptional regulator
MVCSGQLDCGLKQVWTDVRLATEKILFETSFADVCARSVHSPSFADLSKAIARASAQPAQTKTALNSLK